MITAKQAVDYAICSSRERRGMAYVDGNVATHAELKGRSFYRIRMTSVVGGVAYYGPPVPQGMQATAAGVARVDGITSVPCEWVVIAVDGVF